MYFNPLLGKLPESVGLSIKMAVHSCYAPSSVCCREYSLIFRSLGCTVLAGCMERCYLLSPVSVCINCKGPYLTEAEETVIIWTCRSDSNVKFVVFLTGDWVF